MENRSNWWCYFSGLAGPAFIPECGGTVVLIYLLVIFCFVFSRLLLYPSLLWKLMSTDQRAGRGQAWVLFPFSLCSGTVSLAVIGPLHSHSSQWRSLFCGSGSHWTPERDTHGTQRACWDGLPQRRKRCLLSGSSPRRRSGMGGVVLWCPVWCHVAIRPCS